MVSQKCFVSLQYVSILGNFFIVYRFGQEGVDSYLSHDNWSPVIQLLFLNGQVSSIKLF